MRRFIVVLTTLLLLALDSGIVLQQALAQRGRARSMSRGSVRYSPQSRSSHSRYSRGSSGYPGNPSAANRNWSREFDRNRSRNIPDGTHSFESRRGGSGQLSQSTQGDTRTREIEGTTRKGTEYEGTGTVKRTGEGLEYQREITTSEGGSKTTSGKIKVDESGKATEAQRQTEATSRYGDSASRSGEVKRDGDTIEYKREGENRYGDQVKVEGKIETDDGRVEKIERTVEAEGRYGEEIKREQEAERTDGYWDYEGKTETSTGREVEIDAVAGRDLYGRPVAYGVADTKYWGDYGVVRGPHGGAVVSTLPNYYVPVHYYGNPYYYYGGLYYRPYYYGGAPYYYAAYPPYGAYYGSVPVSSVTIVVSGDTYYEKDNVYYQKTQKEGQTAYEVVPAPNGAKVKTLPEGAAMLTTGGLIYHFFGNTFYRQIEQAGEVAFVVVETPAGVRTVEELPADFAPLPVGQVTCFVADQTYYLPWLRGEAEVYLIVDPLPQAVLDKAADSGPDPGALIALQSEVTVPAGTTLRVRTGDELNSGTNQTGDAFVAYLDADLSVDGAIVASRGSRLYGKLIAVKKAGNFSGTAELELTLTEITVSSGLIPISCSSYSIDGEKARSLAVVGVGTGLGAVIGAAADGGKGAATGAAIGAGTGVATAAATPGKQVVIAPQTLLDFEIIEPVIIRPGQ